MARPPLPSDPPPVSPAPVPPAPVPPAPVPPVPPVPAPPRSTLPAVIHEPSPVLAPPAAVAPESRMLPPHQTKLDRVTGHLAALSGDLREWTELRITLVKRQIEGVQAQIDRVQHLLEAAPFFVGALVLAIIALLFLFVAVALGIGALVGSDALGFLITTVLLVVGAVLLGVLGMRRLRKKQAEAAEARRLARDKTARDPETLRQAQADAVRNAAV